MATTVQNLLQKALGDGARNSKWDVAFSFSSPDVFPSAENVAVMCKSSSLPARGMQKIDLKIKGRTVPVRGQVKYSNDWQCTFYSDPEHKLKHAFETWINACDEGLQYGDPDNDTITNIKDHANHGYTTEISVYQCDFDETRNACRYILYGVFPTEVSPITLESESGTIETFTVTFAYTYFDIDNIKGVDGNFVGGFMSTLRNASRNLMNKLTGVLTNQIENFLNGSGINALADNLASFPGRVLNSVTDAFGDAFSEALSLGLTSKTKGFSSGFANSLASGVGKITGMLNGALSGVTNAMKSAVGAVGALAGKVTAAVGNVLSSIGESIGNMISGAIDGIGDFLMSTPLGKLFDSGKTVQGGGIDSAKTKAQSLNNPVMNKVYQTKVGQQTQTGNANA